LSDEALANLSKHLERSSRVIISFDGKVGYGFEQGVKSTGYQLFHEPW
jgi:hypothetical protein